MTSRPSWQKPAIPFPRLILILSLCSAFAPFATDMYLPAFSQLVNHFQTDAGHIETTVSFFFLGLSVGQILYGPLIDRFGRRKPMLAGIAVFLLATFGCLLVTDINTFIGLRLLQAIGGCCGMIIGRAIVSDLFAQHEMARVMSSLMIVMSMAPICAPLIGGWIVTHYDWQAVFFALLLLGTICGLAVYFGLPETKPPHITASGNLLRGYLTLLQRPAYLVPALSGSLTQSCMFGFITGSPFVFLHHFGLNEQQYSWVFGCITFAFIISAQLTKMALRRYSPKQIFSTALLANSAFGLMLYAVTQTPHMWLFIIPLWLTIATLSFLGATSTALAMSNAGDHTGSASCLIGLLQFGCGFIASSVIAASQNGTPYPMTITIAACGLLGTLLWFSGSCRRSAELSARG